MLLFEEIFFFYIQREKAKEATQTSPNRIYSIQNREKKNKEKEKKKGRYSIVILTNGYLIYPHNLGPIEIKIPQISLSH